MTPNPEYAALVRNVLVDPSDDFARGVVADWLEEHGDGERAEFIRVQLALAKEPEFINEYKLAEGATIEILGFTGRNTRATLRTHNPRYAALKERERELLNNRGYGWCDGLIGDFKTHGTAKHGTTVKLSYANSGPFELTFSRGFISRIELSTADFMREGVAKAIFEAAPVESVRLTDKTAVAGWNRTSGERSSQIPQEIFDISLDLFYDIPDPYARLSASCVIHGREQAGLPPLPVESGNVR